MDGSPHVVWFPVHRHFRLPRLCQASGGRFPSARSFVSCESIELFPAEMFGRKLSSISFSRKAASYAAAFDARGMDMRRLQHFLGHADHGTKCQQRPMTGLMHCSITRSLYHLVGAWAQIKMQGH